MVGRRQIWSRVGCKNKQRRALPKRQQRCFIIWLCAEIGRTGWSQTPVSERTCGFDSHQSYKYTFVVERQTRYTKDVESERALRVRIPPKVQYGSVAKLVVRIRLDQEKVVSEIRLLWREIP